MGGRGVGCTGTDYERVGTFKSQKSKQNAMTSSTTSSQPHELPVPGTVLFTRSPLIASKNGFSCGPVSSFSWINCKDEGSIVLPCAFLYLSKSQISRFYIKIPAFGVRVKGKHQYFHAEGNFGFSQCYPLINLRCTRLYKQLKTLIAASKVLYKHTIYTLEVENAKNVLCRKID